LSTKASPPKAACTIDGPSLYALADLAPDGTAGLPLSADSGVEHRLRMYCALDDSWLIDAHSQVLSAALYKDNASVWELHRKVVGPRKKMKHDPWHAVFREPLIPIKDVEIGEAGVIRTTVIAVEVFDVDTDTWRKVIEHDSYKASLQLIVEIIENPAVP